MSASDLCGRVRLLDVTLMNVLINVSSNPGVSINTYQYFIIGRRKWWIRLTNRFPSGNGYVTSDSSTVGAVKSFPIPTCLFVSVWMNCNECELDIKVLARQEPCSFLLR